MRRRATREERARVATRDRAADGRAAVNHPLASIELSEEEQARMVAWMPRSLVVGEERNLARTSQRIKRIFGSKEEGGFYMAISPALTLTIDPSRRRLTESG